MKQPKDDDEFVIIFRRFRKGKNGRIFDAWKYGKSVWPIKIRKKGKK